MSNNQKLKVAQRFKPSLVETNVVPDKGSSGSDVTFTPLDINEILSKTVNATITSDNGFGWFQGWGAASGKIFPDTDTITITCKFHRSYELIDANSQQPGVPGYKLLAEQQVEVIRDSSTGELSVDSVGSQNEDISFNTEFFNDGLSCKVTFQYNPTAKQDSVVITSTDGSLSNQLEGVNLELEKKVSEDDILDSDGNLQENKIPQIQISKVSGLETELESKLVVSDLEPLETDVSNLDLRVTSTEGEVDQIQVKTQHINEEGKISSDGLQEAAVDPTKINLPFHILY